MQHVPRKAGGGRQARRARTTGGPTVRLATKWLGEMQRRPAAPYPSMTSTCSQSAPQSASAHLHAAPSAAKSADRMDGATRTIIGLGG